MHTLVLTGVFSVWIFTDTFVDGALTISYSGSNTVNSTNYVLKCDIPGFSSQASMSKNGTLISQCFPSGCISLPKPPYSYRHDATAIYVDFATLADSEDGIQWTCAHIGDTSVNFDVVIKFGKSPDSPKSDTTAIVVGVSIGIVALVILLVGLMIYFKVYKRKGTQSKSKEDNKLVPPVQETPVVTGTQLVPSEQKTPVVTGTQLVPSEQKTPVVTGTQLVPSEQKTPVVTGMPLEPEGPLKIKTRQDHVEFQWNAPKSDGGSEITDYIVEVNGIKFDTWETFAKSSSMKLKVPMEKFKDGKVMSFRVRAENEYGLSKPLSAQKPFTLQNSHDLLANRSVVTNQGRGHDGGISLLEQVPIDRTLPKPV